MHINALSPSAVLATRLVIEKSARLAITVLHETYVMGSFMATSVLLAFLPAA